MQVVPHSSTNVATVRQGMTPDQVALVKRQILKPKNREATDDELALFIGQCERTGLDPFARQIYGIFRWDNTIKDEKLTIQASIDGFRLVAERSGKYVGQDGPWWCGDDKVWTDVWLGNDPPLAAKVVVKKLAEGVVAETPAVAKFDSYKQTFQDGNLMGLWRQMPEVMIAKCAEALALRKAFPQELSGLYTAEEMAQADAAPVIEATAVEVVPTCTPAQIAKVTKAFEQAGVSPEDFEMHLTAVGLDDVTQMTAAHAKALKARLDALTPAAA